MNTNPYVEIQKHYRQRDLTAREWKKDGGKVAGYLCNNVPEEMILAAGFFPLRISGDPGGGTEIADMYAEPFLEPGVRSIFNMLLTGRYNFLDYLIVPHSRDAILALYHHLNNAKQINPEINLPQIYLFDLPHTRFWLSGRYLHNHVLELKKKLEEWSGKDITDKSLSDAILITNENRILLKQVAELRATETPRISGVEALQIIGSSMFMRKESHNILLRNFLSGYDQLPPKDGLRLFIGGSPLDNLQFYELVESLDTVIVSEDNCWGNRYFDNVVDQSIEPTEAITDYYHQKAPCPRMYSINQRVEYCQHSAIKSKAQGAVFFLTEWDNATAWEYPDQKRVLEEDGIPTICLDMQPYLLSDIDKKQIKQLIKQFLEKIKKDGAK